MAFEGLNKAILIGRLEGDPHFRMTRGGKPRLWLRLHTVETVPDGEGSIRDRQAWHSIVVWGKRAESLVSMLRAGRRIAVEGRLVNRSWDGADGRRRHETEVHARRLVLLDGPASAESREPPPERDAA